MQHNSGPHDKELVFIGEVGVHEGPGHIDDYDRNDPDGTAWGRRNYEETGYLSGEGEKEPAEYATRRWNMYREYFG